MRKLAFLATLASGAALATAAWAGRLAWERSAWGPEGFANSGPADALLRRAERDPDHEAAYWRQALERRPRTWEALAGLALEAESRGATAEARRLFDRAVAVNRTFRPQWARLNHLARTGDEPAFWPAARQAFAMSHRDRQALLELCWRMRPDGTFLTGQITGTRPAVLFDATRFLMSRDLPAARLAYGRLLEQPYRPLAESNAGRVATAEERRGLGLDLCDFDLDLGNRAEAWRTWLGMRSHGLVEQVSGRGFDWRPGSRQPGVTGVEVTPAGDHWVVTLTGELAGRESGASWMWRPARPDEPGSAMLPPGLRSWRDGSRIYLGAEPGFRGTIQFGPGGV